MSVGMPVLRGASMRIYRLDVDGTRTEVPGTPTYIKAWSFDGDEDDHGYEAFAAGELSITVPLASLDHALIGLIIGRDYLRPVALKPHHRAMGRRRR